MVRPGRRRRRAEAGSSQVRGVGGGGAGVEQDIHLPSEDASLLVDRRAEPDDGILATLAGEQVLGSLVDQLHRPAGGPRQQRCIDLDAEVELRPEPAADVMTDHPDRRRADSERRGHPVAHVERKLMRDVDGEPPAFEIGDDTPRLEIRLVLPARSVLTLDHPVRRREPLVHTGWVGSHLGADVAPAWELSVTGSKRSQSGWTRGASSETARSRSTTGSSPSISSSIASYRLVGRSCRLRCHRGDRLALVGDPFRREQRLVLDGKTAAVSGGVGSRDDRPDPGKQARSLHVEPLDPTASDGGTEHTAGERSRQAEVDRVGGAAAHLDGTITANRTRADRRHRSPPAVSMTASTIWL